MCTFLYEVFLFWSADTGFKHVKPTEYEPRLLHIKGVKVSDVYSEWLPGVWMCLSLLQKNIEIKQVSLHRESLDSGDVFILDLGLEVYQVSLFRSRDLDCSYTSILFNSGMEPAATRMKSSRQCNISRDWRCGVFAGHISYLYCKQYWSSMKPVRGVVWAKVNCTPLLVSRAYSNSYFVVNILMVWNLWTNMAETIASRIACLTPVLVLSKVW